MQINFAIHGTNFDPIDFLLKARNISKEYFLWDNKELFEEDEGVTLTFSDNLKEGMKELLKFILVNKSFLKNYTESKEILIKFETNILQENGLPQGIWFIPPKLLKVIGDLNITCCISFDD